MPALTWLSPANTRSDANECSPCIRASGEKVPRGWDSVVFYRIKYLPQQQEAAQLGTVSHFKVRCYFFFFFFYLGDHEYPDLETTNPSIVLVAMYLYEDHSFKTKIPKLDNMCLPFIYL